MKLKDKVRLMSPDEGEIPEDGLGVALTASQQEIKIVTALLRRFADDPSKAATEFRDKYAPGTIVNDESAIREALDILGWEDCCERIHSGHSMEVMKKDLIGKPAGLMMISLASTIAQACPVCPHNAMGKGPLAKAGLERIAQPNDKGLSYDDEGLKLVH